MYDIKRLAEDADVETVVEYLGLDTRRMGSKISILCPCHNDRHFGSCYLTKKGFYCFSCHAKGSVFDLVKNVEHISFHDSIKVVAELCGGEGRYVLKDVKSNEDKPHYFLDKDVMSLADLTDERVVETPANMYYRHELDDCYGFDWYPGEKDDDESGYYVKREVIMKRPLQKLADEEPDVFHWLLVNKAWERRNTYLHLRELSYEDTDSFIRDKVINPMIRKLDRVINEYKAKLRPVSPDGWTDERTIRIRRESIFGDLARGQL